MSLKSVGGPGVVVLLNVEELTETPVAGLTVSGPNVAVGRGVETPYDFPQRHSEG